MQNIALSIGHNIVHSFDLYFVVDCAQFSEILLEQRKSPRKEPRSGTPMIRGVPYIDPTISDIGVSQLRKLNATDLRKGKKTLVVRENNIPLAVVLKYEQFLAMQGKLEAAQKTLDLLAKRPDVQAVLESLKDAVKGEGVDLSDIAPELIKEQ